MQTARPSGVLDYGLSDGNPGPFRGLERSAPFPRPEEGQSRPGARIEFELDSGPSAAAEARAALRVLDGKADTDALEDVRLLVSEVVTNAVRHARSPRGARIGLAVSVVGSAVRAEVSDGGSGFEPAARTKAQDEVGGWGLHLVDRLAARWGVDRGSATRVWFEVDAA
jgi:anti-sigma regulatory factor (Ser/Thr protein kinase)